MITKEILELLQNQIIQYDQKVGKDYLIAFSKGRNSPCEICELTFYHYNFWHLLGCKFIGEDSFQTYLDCKNRRDISKDIAIVHSLADVYQKSVVFSRLFDFVAHAKEIKIGYADKGPEQFEFKIGIGNFWGIVLYGIQKNNSDRYLIPKSVQEKRLETVSGQCSKILFIISKPRGEREYRCLEYEIKEGIYEDLKEQIKTKLNK